MPIRNRLPVFCETRETSGEVALDPDKPPQARPLPHRTVSIQRARVARIAHRLRQATCAEQNCACARRSTGRGMDARDAVSAIFPDSEVIVPTPGVEIGTVSGEI